MLLHWTLWFTENTQTHFIPTTTGRKDCMKKQGNKKKNDFRKTSIWQSFRKKIIEERGCICQCCGVHTKRLQLHHMDEKNYEDLNPDKFVLLCSRCHTQVSFLERIKKENWVKYNPEWVAFYSRYLL